MEKSPQPEKHDVREAEIASSPEAELPVDEAAILRKIDWHLVPYLSLLYLLSFLDRSSIGNAKLYNMEADLGISDTQYLIALTIFFFPYSIFEMPSNVALKRLRPSHWLSFLMLAWGIIMMCHGFARNYKDLLALRFLLGLFESGLYPGIAFYLSCWYKRTELGMRVAVFFSAATVSGAFGGLLAAAIANMDGIGGKPAWAWIFILEGLLTVLVASVSFWAIQDFPDTAKFLSKDERAFVIARLQEDQQFSAAGESFNAKYIWQSLTDKKMWIALGMLMGSDGPLYAFSLFTPTIINQLGFQATAANLLSVPVYSWACLVTCIFGYLGDRYGERGRLNMILYSTGLVGYIILVASRSAALSYFATYLAASGIYATIPNTATWVATNTEGSYKRSAVLGLIIGWGNLNGAVTSNVYRNRDKPWFSLGHGIVLTYIGIGLVSTIVMRMYLKSENARRERGERAEIIDQSGGRDGVIYGSVDAARTAKGDRWSGFRYSL